MMTMKRDRDTQESGSRDRRPVGDRATEQQLSGSEAEALLGRKLAVVYSELVEQPVPDRFKKLLDQLKKDSQRE